ncbi:MAG: hypothetical protein HUK40_19675 [Desulfobacter sp.]|nr:hypothetical protein [Desulfobacter sp.]WDP86206.1 MAG: hypothetical protein HUN05_14605 [Desulfobacter sp.]
MCDTIDDHFADGKRPETLDKTVYAVLCFMAEREATAPLLHFIRYLSPAFLKNLLQLSGIYYGQMQQV